VKLIVRAAIVAAAFLTQPVSSQEIVIDKVDFAIPGTSLTLLGELRIPKVQGTLPTVLILHSAGGIDGTGIQYAKALNERGIATMELNFLTNADWFQNAAITKVAILYLSRKYGLDPKRFGSMGFSHGAMVSLVNATEASMKKPAQENPVRFRAHASLYPLCGVMSDAHESEFQLNLGRVATSGKPNFLRGMFTTMTGAPVLILAGADEDYEDAPVECPKLLGLINSSKPNVASLTVYGGAGHGWDVPNGRTYTDKYSRKNGTIRHYRSQPTYEKSIKAVVEFFDRELKN
jgi:dienelactone hydrolase